MNRSDLNQKLFEAQGGKIRMVENGYAASRAGQVGQGCSPGAAMYNAGFPDLTIEYGPLMKLIKRLMILNNYRLELSYDTLPDNTEVTTARFETRDTYVTRGIEEGPDERIVLCLLALKELQK